jgi:dihydroorotate dehydrogenase (fumarate)
MADLRTSYMGFPIASPIVVGACSLSKRIDTIKEIEAAGAGALVIKSLFEEQVRLEGQKFYSDLTKYDNQFSEALSFFPRIEHAGPREHLFWVKEAKKSVKMPLVASLNAVEEDVWVDYSKRLADTGVDGLELNFYSTRLDPTLSSCELENKEFDIFAHVREAVKIPVAVKLHSNYTSMMDVAATLDRLGVNALVLFNRFFQPDINIDKEELTARLELSHPRDGALSLRWTALLYGRVQTELVAATGVISGADAIKRILAGAGAVQVVSTLYQNGVQVIGKMRADIESWMDQKGYASIKDFQGKVSKQNSTNPWSFERGQYIKLVLGFD